MSGESKNIENPEYFCTLANENMLGARILADNNLHRLSIYLFQQAFEFQTKYMMNQEWCRFNHNKYCSCPKGKENCMYSCKNLGHFFKLPDSDKKGLQDFGPLYLIQDHETSIGLLNPNNLDNIELSIDSINKYGAWIFCDIKEMNVVTKLSTTFTIDGNIKILINWVKKVPKYWKNIIRESFKLYGIIFISRILSVYNTTRYTTKFSDKDREIIKFISDNLKGKI